MIILNMILLLQNLKINFLKSIYVFLINPELMRIKINQEKYRFKV